MEIGPYRVNEDQTLRRNNGSWNEFANLLFVDNPVGTGFSYVDTDSFVHELDEMADQFVIFLEKFFEVFPQYEKDEVGLAAPFHPNHLDLKTNCAHRSTLPGNHTLASIYPTLPEPSWTATKRRRTTNGIWSDY